MWLPKLYFFVWTGLEQAHFAGAALQFHDNMDLRDHKCPAKIEFILVDGFTVGGKSRFFIRPAPLLCDKSQLAKKWQKLVTRVMEVISYNVDYWSYLLPWNNMWCQRPCDDLNWIYSFTNYLLLLTYLILLQGDSSFF